MRDIATLSLQQRKTFEVVDTDVRSVEERLKLIAISWLGHRSGARGKRPPTNRGFAEPHFQSLFRRPTEARSFAVNWARHRFYVCARLNVADTVVVCAVV